MKKLFSTILLTLLLLSVLSLAFNIQPVKAEPTTIVVPDDYPTIQEAINAADPGDTVYVYNGTYYENVVVNKTLHLVGENRENAIIDARGIGDVLRIEADNVTVSDFTIRYGDNGIYLSGSHGSTICNNNITKNRYSGITVYSSTGNNIEWNIIGDNHDGINLANLAKDNTIQENTVTNNGIGIYLRGQCGNNSVQGNIVQNNQFAIYIHFSNGNNITDNVLTNSEYCIYITSSTENEICSNVIANNHWGIYFDGGNDNKIYHNNFIDNLIQAHISISFNIWDDSYPSGGNFWSNYTGVDADADGIGDTQHTIDENNADRYPLIAPNTVFDAGTWDETAYHVNLITNSTASNFQLNTTQKTISFNVTGTKGTAGFCRVTIPNIIVQDLWQGNYTVLFNGESCPFRNWTDATNTYIYINYTHSEHEIIIIPEFPSTIILPLFTLTTLIATVLLKKKRKTKPQLP